ncbi:A/G-specific adenine glycosylase [Arcanobacterium haemolyticum]|nr:A/G-specific adenine glycosylase [Arcanobacterium haemolyticum]
MHNELITWYIHTSRPLPWRETGTSAWAILVCEVMSQQTPVARVMPSWYEWLERWPTPADLAAASPSEVIVAWGNLGYPRRALRLRECAIAVTEKWGGELPQSRDDLLSLPGIGPYTADAIISFAYKRRATVLDTNIRRVIARQHGEAYPPSSLTKAEIARAEALVPDDDAESSLWNAAIMELGALVCTARNPQCENCPIADSCQWLARGRPESTLPKRTQAFVGTHREARGKIMAVLRARTAPISRAELQHASRLPDSRFEPALASLLSDGLATTTGEGIDLPQASPRNTPPSSASNAPSTSSSNSNIHTHVR